MSTKQTKRQRQVDDALRQLFAKPKNYEHRMTRKLQNDRQKVARTLREAL